MDGILGVLLWWQEVAPGQVDVPLPEPSGGDLLSGVTAAGLLAFIVAMVKIAMTQADKRAAVAEKREEACIASHQTTLGTLSALTAEVRANGEKHRQHMEPIERGIAELLDHARREN